MTMTVGAAQRGAALAAPTSILSPHTALTNSMTGHRVGVPVRSRTRVVCCKAQGPVGPPSHQRPAQRLVAPYAPFDQRCAQPKPDPQSGLSPLVSVLAWFVGGVGAFSLLRTAFLSWAQVQANKQARKQFLEEQKQKQQLQQARRYGRRAAGDQPQADQNGGSGPVAVEVEVEVEVEAGGRAPGTSKAGGAKDVAEAEWRGDRGPGQQPEADGEVEQQQAEEGVKVQIASYRVPSTKPTNNLGRVVFCARLAGPWDLVAERQGQQQQQQQQQPQPQGAGGEVAADTLDWHRRFWEPLLAKYSDGPADRVTGLLVLYGNTVLHIMEGDNNQLFALLRELRPSGTAVHRLADIRVPIYVLDVRDRTFDIWSIARASPPDQQATTDADAKASARRRLLRGSLAAAAAAAGGGGGGGGGQSMSLSELSAAATSGAIKDPEAALAAAAAAAKAAAGGGEGVEVEGAGAGAETRSPEERLVSLIMGLELFVKFVGPKLSGLATQGSLAQALTHLSDFESTTPKEELVEQLVADPLAPSLWDFVSAYDADYERYVTLVALLEQQKDLDEQAAAAAGGRAAAAAAPAPTLLSASDAAELLQLGRYYSEHLQRDLKEALAERMEEREATSAAAVAQRLARSVRLGVRHV